MKARNPKSEIRTGTDHAVREWSTVRPRARKDLRFSYQDDQGTPVYVVEDLINRRYHQLGLSEYRFLRSLDGSRTVAELIARSAAESTEKALGEHDVSTFLRWLLDQQLLDAGDAGQAGRRAELAESQDEKTPKKWLTKLVFLKIPLGNPDAFLGGVARFAAWTLSVPAMIIWLAVVLYGVVTVVKQGDALYRAGAIAILPANWFYLIVIFAILKIVHEIWHGVAAKRFGVVVPECGIQLIAWVTPLTYVDASASWSLPSRFRRIVVAFAGIYVELFIAAIAIHVWRSAESAWISATAANVVFAASTVTLLFNANPLMRFDGYYILSDLTGIRNLGTRGQQMLKRFASRIFLGLKQPTPADPRRESWLIFTYGLLAFFWRILITLAIMIMVANLLRGVGLILVFVFVAGGLIAMATGFVKLVRKRPERAFGMVARLAIWIGLAAVLLWAIRFNPASTAVVVVRNENAAALRAECPGFVRELHCKHGQLVAAGEPLVTADNLEETAMLTKIELDLRRSELRSLQYLSAGRIPAWEAEMEVVKGLRQRLASQTDRVATLEFHAPVAGRVYAPKLEFELGRYLQTGQQLLAIFPDETPALLVSASQKDSDRFNEGDSIRVRLRGRPGELKAALTKVEKRATSAIPHPALASTAGGPLAVVQNRGQGPGNRSGIARETSDSEAMRHFGGLTGSGARSGEELAGARIAATADFEATGAKLGLAEGEWGYARLDNGSTVSVGGWLWEWSVRYVRNKFNISR